MSPVPSPSTKTMTRGSNGQRKRPPTASRRDLTTGEPGEEGICQTGGVVIVRTEEVHQPSTMTTAPISEATATFAVHPTGARLLSLPQTDRMHKATRTGGSGIAVTIAEHRDTGPTSVRRKAGITHAGVSIAA